MNRARRTAVFAVASILIGVGAPAAASAKTVGNGANGTDVAVTSGRSLTINLTPGDSASTGYHWRVAKKPAASVLKLQGIGTTGALQVFSYKALKARTTSLKLQYVSPGRHARVAKTFRLRVFVAQRTPHPGCFGGQFVAQNSVAHVFFIRRNVVTRNEDDGKLSRHSFDEYYGCVVSKDRAYRLDNGDLSGNSTTGAAPNGYTNVTLKGTLVGYVFSKACPFSRQNLRCGDGFAPRIDVQDLATGKLIRSVEQVNVKPVTAENLIAGFVMSRSGDIAWIELDYEVNTPSVLNNRVYRSDLPAKSGEAFAADHDEIDADPQHQVDAESLELDGNEVTWMRAGKLQRAPLR
jgi:predicted secreted protein